MNYQEEKNKIEEKFNKVKKELDETNAKARGLAEELVRIQGEHRFVVALENKEKSNEHKK